MRLVKLLVFVGILPKQEKNCFNDLVLYYDSFPAPKNKVIFNLIIIKWVTISNK